MDTSIIFTQFSASSNDAWRIPVKRELRYLYQILQLSFTIMFLITLLCITLFEKICLINLKYSYRVANTYFIVIALQLWLNFTTNDFLLATLWSLMTQCKFLFLLKVLTMEEKNYFSFFISSHVKQYIR